MHEIEKERTWQDAFDERHQFDVYPDHFMTGLRNEFCAGWHTALKSNARAIVPQAKLVITGHCRKGDDCVCGGDLPRVREGCGNWVKGEAVPQAVGLTDEQILEIAELAWTANRHNEERFYLAFARAVIAATQGAPNAPL